MVATGANQMNLASGCNPNSENDSRFQLELSVAMMATVRFKSCCIGQSLRKMMTISNRIKAFSEQILRATMQIGRDVTKLARHAV